MFANVPHKDYSLLQPMMGNGMNPVLRGMIYPAAGFLELIFIFFYNITFVQKSNYIN